MRWGAKSSIQIVTGVLGVFFMTGCYRPPHDAELIQNFKAHRAEFDRLLAPSARSNPTAF